jgi:Cytochrome c7 and related cytochrome c
MSQIFRPSANSVARIMLTVTGVLVAASGYLVYELGSSPYVTRVYEARQQPIQFSHERHVGGNGLDCRYCHTSVETSAVAGIPSTKICMNCHSQILSTSSYLEPVRASFRTDQSLQWVKVHDLPDFVYFNHGIHINKGIGCTTCHGQVDQMPLMWTVTTLQMEWCLDCHRNPEKYVRPRSSVFLVDYQPPADQMSLGRKLVQDYQIQKLTSCSTCHR